VGKTSKYFYLFFLKYPVPFYTSMNGKLSPNKRKNDVNKNNLNKFRDKTATSK